MADDRKVTRTVTAEEELSLLVDAVEDYAIFLLSPQGEIRSWNRGAARILGYTADEVIGRKFNIFYPTEDQGKPAAEIRTATNTGRVEDEGWRIRKDGGRFWANTVITALRDATGQLRGFAKVTRDLTTRRESEERLRQSEEVFRLLVASVKDYAIFMLDPTGHVATWNAGARRIKGYEPEEIIGKHFSVFYPEEEKSKTEWELDVAKEKGVFHDEGWRLRKDGTRFWANVVITAVHDSKGVLRGFAKVTRDMTDHKEAEEMQRALLEQKTARLEAENERRRVEASYQIAREANRAKDDFLMTLSHELRTPMTVILGWARLLPGMSPDDPMFRDAVAAIGRTAQLQARLIDDVLDVSRIMSGKLHLNVEDVDVAGLIQSAIDVVRLSADSKDIAVMTSFGPGLGSISGDRTRLQQVIWNLLSNAVKFTQRDGRIDVVARRVEQHVQIMVRDTGEGIDPSFLSHVFEPFRQAESPRTRVHGGLGLGLSIVRYLVEAHGGTISVESAGKGQGTAFTVTLPTTIASAEAYARTKPSATEEKPALAGVSILLVEDDIESRQMIAASLRQAGAKVTAKESARGALYALTEGTPDIVITDIAMPLMDGVALATEIRRRPEYAKVKIVALSAFPRRGLDAPREFDEYLLKPIDPFELVSEIARIMRRS